jgi:tripartite ATP-independent transporter DctM subunit
MDRGTIALTMVPVMLIGMSLGMPFFAAMGTTGLVYGVAAFGTRVLPIADMKVFGFLMESSFVGVPMFILMGTLLAATGIAESLFFSIYKFFGPVRGGLLVAVGFVCTLMAACTGTSSGPIATMALAALPSMLKQHYKPSIACGCISACGTLGTLIPPSNMLIILGLQAEIPIGRLYFAAFMPGFVTAGIYMLYMVIKAWITPYDAPAMSKEDMGEVNWLSQTWMVIRDVLPVLFMVFSILGVIYLGVATATEGAGVGAFGALILSIIYKKFTFRAFTNAVTGCYRATAMTAGLMIGANFFSSVFLAMGGGAKIVDIAAGFGVGATGIIMLVLTMNFILGFVMGSTSIILILIPIFWPVLKKFGVEELWFSMMFVMMTQVGYLTPPYAQGIYLLKPLAPPEILLKDCYQGIIPFVLLMFLVTVLLWFFPAIATWLPNSMAR